MQNTAQPNLPPAHIIASDNNSVSRKGIIIGISVAVVVLVLGLGGYIAYIMYQKNALENKLLESIHNAPPYPTIGIPSPTKVPTPTIKPTPTHIPLLLPASPSGTLATPSATPIFSY